jgi:hypothetical protein
MKPSRLMMCTYANGLCAHQSKPERWECRGDGFVGRTFLAAAELPSTLSGSKHQSTQLWFIFKGRAKQFLTFSSLSLLSFWFSRVKSATLDGWELKQPKQPLLDFPIFRSYFLVSSKYAFLNLVHLFASLHKILKRAHLPNLKKIFFSNYSK